MLLDNERNRHRDRMNALLAAYGLDTDDPRVYLLKGNPAASIRGLAHEQGADLIVMGTVGRVGIPGFFIGNTAEEVLQTTSASVLMVKPTGFVSPVTPRPVA